MEAVRVGMIGVGNHARQVLLPALSQVSSLRLVCACTAHEETARAASEELRLPCYVGYETMLAEADIEGALVVGGQHEPEICACLEAGKHVFCETLGIASHEGAQRIRELRDRQKKAVEIGFCLRYAPVYRKMKAMLSEWRQADPSERMVVARYYPWIYHFYNLLLFLNGAIDRVLVSRGRDQQILSLEFAGGDIGAVISRNFHNTALPYEMVEISGMGGVLRASNGNELRFDRAETEADSSGLRFDLAAFEGFHPSFSLPYGNLKQLYLRGYIPELEDFARCARSGDAPASTVEDAERTLYVHEAVEEAKKGEGWVPVRKG